MKEAIIPLSIQSRRRLNNLPNVTKLVKSRTQIQGPGRSVLEGTTLIHQVSAIPFFPNLQNKTHLLRHRNKSPSLLPTMGLLPSLLWSMHSVGQPHQPLVLLPTPHYPFILASTLESLLPLTPEASLQGSVVCCPTPQDSDIVIL
jgi:hypothetical protein